MKSKHLLLTLFLALLVPWAANAQTLGEYTFSTGTDATKWVTLTSSATQLLTYTAYTDSQASDVTDIGFTFPFGEGGTYTQFSVNTDGNLRLGSTKTGTSNYGTPFSSSNANQNNPKINALGCDGALNVSGHYVKSELVGSNLLVVEFSEGTWKSETRSMLYKWQVHLYSNGDIEIVFPDADNLPETNPAVDHQCGMCVNSADGWIITLSDNAATHFTSGTDATNASGTWFDANRYYRFTRPVIACPRPLGLTTNNITHEQTTITWTSDETAWEIVSSTDPDFDPDLATPIPVTAKTYTFTGLTPLTDYYVYVRSNCTASDNGYSNWSDVCHFSTTAVSIAVGDSWTDDFEGESCGWELINGTLTNAWAWGTATNNGGTHALYVSNDGGTSNAYSHSPAIVYATKLLQFADTKYEFSYDWNANGESSYDYMRVALVPASVTLTAGTTVPTGFGISALPTGWIAVDGGSKLNLSTAWATKTLSVNVPAGNYYLVMAWRNDGGGGNQPPAAVDNVSITRVTCPYDVTGLAVSNITTTGATLSWTAGEATGWQVAYSTNSSFENATEVIVEEASYIVPELTSATTYYVKVRAYCGGEDFGEWSSVISFKTACEALTEYPYTENFDSYTGVSSGTTNNLPFCWNYINTCTYSSYKGYPVIYYASGYSYSGDNHLRFYTSYSSYSNYDPQDQYAILPPMENLNGKQLTLFARGANTNSTFKVGMMTDPTDATTFVEIATTAPTTSYDEYTYNLTGEGNYVAIMVEAATSSATSRTVYIDNITIDVPPTCVKPTDLEFVSATTTSATIRWTNGAEGQTAWQIAYSTDPAFDPDEVTPVDVTENPATIDGLTAATIYYAYVRANCGNDAYSDWSVAYVQFATACDAISTFPVSYKFETTEGFPANASTPTTNQLGACWRNEATLQNGTNSSRVWGTSTTYKHEGSQALVLPDKGNSTNFAKTMLVFPEMVFTSERGYTVSFWIYRNGTATTPEGFKVYISDTDTISANAVELGHYSRNYAQPYPVIESASGWYYYEIQIPQSTMTGNVFLIFEGQSYYGSATYVDEVLVKETPTCQTPTGLAFVSSTLTTATIGWTNGAEGQTAWQIAYSTDPAFDPDEVTPVDVTENPGTIEGLTAATIYYAYVRANCGSDEYSDWSAVYVQFATECEAITEYPYSENFDSYTGVSSGTTNNLPVCWNYINTCTNSSYKGYPVIYNASGYSYSGDNHLRFYTYYSSYSNYDPQDQYAILPAMENLNGKQLTFFARGANTNSTFKVGMMTDPTDATTFVEIATTTPTTSYDEYTYNLTGEGNYVAIMVEAATSSATSRTVYIDNITIDVPPTCVKPTDLEFVSATATSATIRWTNGAEGQTAWQIAYSTDPAFDPDEVTPVDVTENPGTIDGLTAATTYYAYVRANCGNDEYSDWSVAYVQFATECEVITVAEGSTYAYDFESETPWGCWTNVAGTNGRTSSNNHTPEGTYKLQFKGTTTGNIVAMPAFTPDINGLMLTFWTRPEGYNYPSCGTFSVGYMTDLDDASTFVAVDTYSYDDWTGNAYVEKTAVFTDAPAGAYIAFCHNALSTIYYWFVDDVEVSVAAPATVTQTTQLVVGWNWFSLSVEMDPAEALEALEEALGDNATYIKSRNAFVEFDEDEWDGTLSGLTVENMYMIELTAGCTVELEGMPADPTQYEIEIKPGWNWIGFPSAEEVDVEDALAGFEAEEGDKLKSRSGYTEFDGEEWEGSLTKLVPGQGYMYLSTSDETKPLIFQTGAKSRRQ